RVLPRKFRAACVSGLTVPDGAGRYPEDANQKREASMKDDRSQLSSSQSECSTACIAWRGVGYAVAIASVLALLVATSGSQVLHLGDQVKSATTGSLSYATTVALYSHEHPDRTFPIHASDVLGEQLANFAAVT